MPAKTNQPSESGCRAAASRETITRLLSEFRRNDLAELKGSMLIIHNHPALKNLVRA